MCVCVPNKTADLRSRGIGARVVPFRREFSVARRLEDCRSNDRASICRGQEGLWRSFCSHFATLASPYRSRSASSPVMHFYPIYTRARATRGHMQARAARHRAPSKFRTTRLHSRIHTHKQRASLPSRSYSPSLSPTEHGSPSNYHRSALAHTDTTVCTM